MKTSICLLITEEPMRWRYYKQWLEEYEGVEVDVCQNLSEVEKYLNEKKYNFGLISNTMFGSKRSQFNAGTDEIAPLFETQSIPYVLLSTLASSPSITDKNLKNCILADTMLDTGQKKISGNIKKK